MPSLINDKDTAKEFVRINFINDVSSLPDFQLAAERFLIPIIGLELYTLLLDQVIDFDFPEAPAEPVAIEDDELLKKCRAVVAPLGYLMELATIQTQLTDAGLRSLSTENMQAAHRWEYNEVKDNLADKGAYAIEALLKYLFDNIDDYDEWADSEEYQEAASLIFTTGTDFNKYFRLHLPFRTWWEFRALISEVEDFYINSAIGKDFFKSLKDNAEDASAEEKEAITLIKKSVAHLTIIRAIEKKSVKISPLGFTVKSLGAYSEGTGYDDEQAPGTDLSMLYASCERSGEAYLLQLIEYLNSKASETVFADFFTSDKYVAPSAALPESKNANRKIFGF